MINNLSRYNYAKRVRLLGGTGDLLEYERFDIRPRVVKTQYPDNAELQPSQGDNWSRLAWKSLGDGQLYWVICDFSEVIDPFSELVPEVKARYVTRLGANIAAGSQNTATLINSRGIRRGTVLRFEDLDPTHLVSVDAPVLSVESGSHVVTFSPTTFPVGGVPSTYSRVSIVSRQGVRLVCPSPQRALMQVLDFGNPLNTMEEG